MNELLQALKDAERRIAAGGSPLDGKPWSVSPALEKALSNLDDIEKLLRDLLSEFGPDNDARNVIETAFNVISDSTEKVIMLTGSTYFMVAFTMADVGIVHSEPGYTPAIRNLLLENVEAVCRVISVAESEIRQRAIKGQAFGLDPVVVAGRRLDEIIGVISPYTHLAPAAWLSVTISTIIKPELAEHQMMMNAVCRVVYNDVKSVSEPLWAAFTSTLEEMPKQVTSTFQRLKEAADQGPTPETAAEAAKANVDFLAGVRDGLTTEDAAAASMFNVEIIGTSLGNQCSPTGRRALKDPGEYTSSKDILGYWGMRRASDEIAQSMIEEALSTSLVQLLTLYHLALAHSPELAKKTLAHLRENLGVFIPAASSALQTGLDLQAFDRGEVEHGDGTALSSQCFERWTDFLDETVPKDAMLRTVGPAGMLKCLSLFRDIEDSADTFRQMLSLVLVEERDITELLVSTYATALDKIVDLMIDGLTTLPEKAGEPEKHLRQLQLQYASGVDSGMDAFSILLGLNAMGISLREKARQDNKAQDPSESLSPRQKLDAAAMPAADAPVETGCE